MPFDGFVMAAVARELREGESGAFLDQVYQPAAEVVALALTGHGPRRFWILSAEAEGARCHAQREKPAVPDTAPAFCMLLRKHLRGARLREVVQPEFDRILHLRFERGEEVHRLVLEVMGRHSNLFLLDETDRILGAAKIVPPSRSRARPVLPGNPYEPPPTGRPDPRRVDAEQFAALAGEGPLTPEWLVRTFNGFSPFAAAEVLARRGGAEVPAVWEAFHDLLARSERGDFEPTLLRDATGAPADYWAFRPARPQVGEPEAARSLSAAIHAVHSHRAETGASDRLRAELAAAVRRVLQAQERQREEAERQLEGLADLETLRISGELLLGARDLPRGAASVELPNYYDPEQRPLTIALEPEFSPRENAERYFRKYRRGQAAAERAVERLPAVEARIAELEALLREVEEAAPEALPALRERLRAAGIAREAQAAPERAARERKELPPGVRIRHVRRDGWEILWGENATSNDYLTTRVAAPGDTWLHARAVTGAHVVVRGEQRGAEVPRAILETAARTAAAHSDAKHSSVVAVDYTQRRYVRKPRGAPPGSVLYQNEKTLHATASDAEEGTRVE